MDTILIEDVSATHGSPDSGMAEGVAEPRVARADLTGLAIAILAGLALSTLPSLLWWPRLGTPVWLADNDELLYLTYTTRAYFEHPFRLVDSVPLDDRPCMYPRLLFLPAVLVARALSSGPLSVDLIWRIFAGVGMAAAWFAFFRQVFKRSLPATLGALVMLSDIGLVYGRPFLRHVHVLALCATGRESSLLALNPQIHTEWRIITPGLSLPFFIAFLVALGHLRFKSTRTTIGVAGATFAVLFYAYFYYWTTAAATLALLFLLDPPCRRRCAAASLIGLVAGAPALAEGVVFKTDGAQDWQLRCDVFLPIGHFNELQLPRVAIASLVLCGVWVFVRRWDVLHVWCAAVAAIFLMNHQVVTGLQVNNFHWCYAWGPALSALILVLLMREGLLLHWTRARTAVLCSVVAAYVGSGVHLRCLEALRTEESKRHGRDLIDYTGQRAAAPVLAHNSVTAGDPSFVDLAAIIEDQRPLQHYALEISPAVSDHEYDVRWALNARLRGISSVDFRMAQGDPQGWVLGPIARDPAKRAAWLARRVAIFEAMREKTTQVADEQSVRYVALPARQEPPAYLSNGWNRIQSGPRWQIWERDKR